MGRSKGLKARHRREREEQEELDERLSPTGERARIKSTEQLFREGEVLDQTEIERRIEQSGLVRRSDDEFFRLVKARFFKRSGGDYIVRG